MAREGGGGGGAFGWTILGILVGVAGTLAVETLMHNQHAAESAAEPASAASVAVQPVAPESLAPPVVEAQRPANVAAVSAAPVTHAQTQSQEDVEEDATAAGMTSRSRPASGDSQQPVPGGGN